MKIKFDRFFFLGAFVFLSVFANQYVNFVRWHDPLEMLWFCDMTALILGVGLMLGSRAVATFALVMAVPAQFFWIVDFFLESFGYGRGRTAELWSFGPTVFWLSVNLHAILIPISFYVVWKKGFAKKVLPFIVLYTVFLLSASFFLGHPADNRNCVFYPCDSKNPGGGYLRHFIFSSLLFWQVIFVASFFLHKNFFLYFEHKKVEKYGKNINSKS